MRLLCLTKLTITSRPCFGNFYVACFDGVREFLGVWGLDKKKTEAEGAEVRRGRREGWGGCLPVLLFVALDQLG